MDNKRTNVLVGILNDYLKLVKSARREVDGTLITYEPLEEEDVQELKEVLLRFYLDPRDNLNLDVKVIYLQLRSTLILY